MSADEVNSLLIVVIDTNPVWWGSSSPGSQRELQLSQCLDAVMVLCNSHLMMSHKHRLALIAAHLNNSRFLYPRSDTCESEEELGADRIQRGETDGKYELHARVNDCVTEELKDLILNDKSSEIYSDCLMAGALSLALCYSQRIEKELAFGETLHSRILVIKGAEDNPSQYMNLMNVVFTAQKLNVLIDACVLDNDSGLLQQACDITGGTYLKVPQLQGLLQYLLWVFLPSADTRPKLSLPAKTQVDYRAACFCHRQLIDIGYVCSVCLSIFCSFSPICSTCQTTFKLMPPPKMLKRKSKKSAAL